MIKVFQGEGFDEYHKSVRKQFEKVTTMTGIQQMDKLDEENSVVIARAASGSVNLQVVPLP